MKHPHPDRLAEVYRKTDSEYKWIGYTTGRDDPKIKDAIWTTELQGWVLPPRVRPRIEE